MPKEFYKKLREAKIPARYLNVIISEMKKIAVEVPDNADIRDTFDWKPFSRYGQNPSGRAFIMWFLDYCVGKANYKLLGQDNEKRNIDH